MMWKHLHNKSRRGGFTLLEMMAVVGLIVILLGVAIFGVTSAQKTMKLKEYDDYAKTIFMAAQSNLAAMRANGELEGLQTESESGWYRINQFPNIQFPHREADDEYYWTGSHLEGDPKKADTYAMVLPAHSVEAVVRDNWVIIEYNPITGNVFSVLYCPANSLGRETLWGLYLNGNLPRDEQSRKKLGIGYYCGSVITSNDLEPEKTEVEMNFTNGEEGVLDMGVAIPNSLMSSSSAFIDGLDVKLTLTGELSGNTMELDIVSSTKEDLATVSRESSGTVRIRYILDSLANYRSFANLSAGETGSITSITDQRRFTILPGENVTIQAEVSYNGKGGTMDSRIGILAGVNPMFDYLLPGTGSGKYVLAVSNGRNLQNLNALVPSIADAVELVVFSDDIYWNETVAYYNNVYGTAGAYANASDEAPARALPYFVPIHNELLLGSAWFNGTSLQYSHENYASGGAVMTRDYADVVGNGKMVVGLNIDSTRYAIPTQGHYYVTNGYINADGQKVGGRPTVGYHYTGLFAYVNTNVSDLNIVNSFIKGLDYIGENDLTVATGSLAGVAGPNALFTDCGVYIINNASQVKGYYDFAAMSGPKAYSVSNAQTWYGVSGQGAVGGLVGYSMSSHAATGDLTEDTDNLAFVRCFGAVPVSGGMRGNGNKDYGYTNGVGGLVGVSNLSNFLSCYASGDVLANGVYVSGKTTAWSVLDLDGKVSFGAGGFVGTSHGSRFSNCFATGDVTGDAALGAGGFVGVMCYDGGFDYRCDGLKVPLKQFTVFTSCYCVGEVTNANGKTENFAGGMASDRTDAYITADSKIYTDYYLMYAPYWVSQGIGYLQTPGSVAVPDLSKTNSGYFYIYKDCCYLDRSLKEDSVIPNKADCGSASGYNHMMNMLDDHGREDAAWIIAQISVIGSCTNENGQTYQNAYLGLGKYPLLNVSYGLEMAKGYDKAFWIEATEALTHPYSFTGGKYLFPLTSGMDYYGDWPTFPLSGGLAYYEYYTDSSRLYAQFDRIDSSDLASAQSLRNRGAAVTSDGYAVMLAGSGQSVKVELGGKTFDLSGVSTASWSYNGERMTAYPLSGDVMSYAASLVSESSFYVKMTITAGGKTYTVYFNPNVANSQINPIMINDTDHTDPAEPSGVPGQIQIRTARQLAALSKSEALWGTQYNYSQVLDIYAGSYSSGYSTSAIGNDTTPFQGSYSGAGGQMVISGFHTGNSGIFGVIGKNGQVKDIKVIASDITLNGKGEYAGIVADENHGTLENVDVTTNGSVTVQANGGAGLLAGFSDGKIYSCDICANGAVTLAGNTVGGAIGVLEGTVSNCSIILSDDYQGPGQAGGFVGKAVNADVSNIQVTLEGDLSASGGNFGGMGYWLEGGSYRDITVTINANASGNAIFSFSGFADDVDNATLEGLQITVNGTLKAIDYATGGVSVLEDSTLSGSSVVINGTLDASAVSAGVLYVMQNSTISTTVVTINGTVSCADGSASGFIHALMESSKATGCTVRLNGGIVTGTTAAGFAMQIDGEVSGSCAVIGNGTVNGTETAAGFAMNVDGLVAAARVTPAVEQSADAYWGLSNDLLVVTGGQEAAGFVMIVNDQATVMNCETLCAVSSTNAYGFLANNWGSVQGCIANVTISGGYAFAGENNGTLTNCYGWYGDGSKTGSTIVTTDGHTACYFVDLDIQETDSLNSVTLIDYQGKVSSVNLSALNSALGKLNGGTMGTWQIPGAYAGYPYSQIASYPFPMLREHCGDWSATKQSFFGVIYYEQYDDSSYKIHVVELSTASGDQASASFYWNNGTMQSTSCFDATGNIADAGYLLFCKDGSDPFGGNLLGSVYTGSQTVSNLINHMAQSQEYQVYNLNTTERFVFYSLGQTVEVVPYFADAIGEPGRYQIRTPYQLSNIHKVEGNFIQTRDITLTGDFNSLASDAPSNGVTLNAGQVYDGNGFKINAFAAKNTWIRSASGTLRNLTVVMGETDNELIHIVTGSGQVSGLNLILQHPMSGKSAVIGSTYGSVQISSVVLNATQFNGVLVRTMTAGLLQVDRIRADVARIELGHLFGDVTGGVVKGGTIDLSNAAVSSNLFRSVTGGAQVEGFEITVDQLRSSLIGTLSGNVTNVILNINTATIGGDGAILVKQFEKGFTPSGSLIPANVEGCQISVTEIQASGDAFGTVCSTLPSWAVVRDCTINVDALQAACKNVGGVVATNEGTLNRNRVTVEIQAMDCAVVGGAAAISSGTVTDNVVDVTVLYTQTHEEKASAIIGGLVGQADGGHIGADASKVTVTGSIVLSSEAVNTGKRNYIVGGVIGKDNAKSLLSITGIQASVAIDGKWAGAADAATYVVDVADKGPVGVFVGYIYRGTFTDCGNSIANTRYQFAGQIGFNNYKTSGGNWFYHTNNAGGEYQYPLVGSDTLKSVGHANGFSALSDGQNYNVFLTEMTNCTFVLNGQAQIQGINVLFHLFTGSVENSQAVFTHRHVAGTVYSTAIN